jgi:hypothetical protein
MRKMLIFAIAGYAIYYFGTQQQKLKDSREQERQSQAETIKPGASGIIFGKGGELSLEACRKEVGIFCASEMGISRKVNCLGQNRAALSNGCSSVLDGN